MKIVVVTAVTADRDVLRERQNTADADFVAFSDRPLRSATWDVRPACDLFRDPVRNAKAHKILPHLYFPNHDASLWIDANLELVDSAAELARVHLAGHDLVFGLHGSHRSLSDELAACLRETLDDPEVMTAQVARYPPQPEASRFPLASVILRRHTPEVARFNALWWAELTRWSRRDQLSLQAAATAAGLEWGAFPRSPALESDTRHRLLASPYFRWYSHGVPANLEVPPGESTGDSPAAWWARRLQFLEALSGQREAYALNLEEELAKRSSWAREAESYARSLERECANLRAQAAIAVEYARSLEQALKK